MPQKVIPNWWDWLLSFDEVPIIIKLKLKKQKIKNNILWKEKSIIVSIKVIWKDKKKLWEDKSTEKEWTKLLTKIKF